MKFICSLVRYLLLVFPIAVVATFLYFLIFVNTNNHTGIHFLNIIWFLLACAAFSIICFLIKKDRRFFVPLAANILAIAFFIYIDHFNIMLQYSEWIERGMPNPYEESHYKRMHINDD